MTFFERKSANFNSSWLYVSKYNYDYLYKSKIFRIKMFSEKNLEFASVKHIFYTKYYSQ